MVATCPGFAGVLTCCIGRREEVDERDDGFILPPLLDMLSTFQRLVGKYVVGSSLIAGGCWRHLHTQFFFSCHLQALAWAAIVILHHLTSQLSLMLDHHTLDKQQEQRSRYLLINTRTAVRHWRSVEEWLWDCSPQLYVVLRKS